MQKQIKKHQAYIMEQKYRKVSSIRASGSLIKSVLDGGCTCLKMKATFQSDMLMSRTIYMKWLDGKIWQKRLSFFSEHSLDP